MDGTFGGLSPLRGPLASAAAERKHTEMVGGYASVNGGLSPVVA